MSLSEILQELPGLTEEERQELQEVLDGYDPERERAWAQLANERFRAIKAGEKKTVDGDEVLAEGRRPSSKASSAVSLASVMTPDTNISKPLASAVEQRKDSCKL